MKFDAKKKELEQKYQYAKNMKEQAELTIKQCDTEMNRIEGEMRLIKELEEEDEKLKKEAKILPEDKPKESTKE